MKIKLISTVAVVSMLLVGTALAKDNTTINLNALKPETKVQKMVHLKQEQLVLKKLKAQARAKHFENYYSNTASELQSASGLHPIVCPSHSSFSPAPKPTNNKTKTNKASNLKQQCPSGIPAFQYSRFANFPPPPPMSTPKQVKKQKKVVLKTLPDVFVKPEVITKVKVSNRDVNRIVSPFPIKDIVYSKEKGVMVSFVGKNAFLKFAIKKLPFGGYEYIVVPTELYIVTTGGVYTIIVQPTAIMGRTIRLSGGTLNKIKQNQAIFSQLPYEKKIIKIIKSAYTNNIPSTWDVLHPAVKPIKLGCMTARLVELINIEGTNFDLKEYEITSNQPVNITEKDFITPKLSKTPAAILLTHFKIDKYNPSYLFIVERKGDSNE